MALYYALSLKRSDIARNVTRRSHSDHTVTYLPPTHELPLYPSVL